MKTIVNAKMTPAQAYAAVNGNRRTNIRTVSTSHSEYTLEVGAASIIAPLIMCACAVLLAGWLV